MKICRKCQSLLAYNDGYCSKCGFDNKKKDLGKLKAIFIGMGIGFLILVIFLCVGFIFRSINSKYYFNPSSYDDKNSIILEDGTAKKYSTVIVYDNTYSREKIKNKRDAFSLIVKDSVSQKGKCPKDILEVENKIINDFGITAVNLCEMDINFARELINVLRKMYTEYPNVGGYITNLTLVNASLSEGYIAAFMPVFMFATADTDSSFPQVIKTQVLLNTAYFLNKDRLLQTVEDCSKSGHFPPNATLYSALAHEFGHYLSFLAMMRSYKLDSILLVDQKKLTNFNTVYDDFLKGDYSWMMIKEAYRQYVIDTNTNMTIDEWRGTISQYALAKDNSGKYIYDETIAEAIHDVYLNSDEARDASKYIVRVLKKKLES